MTGHVSELTTPVSIIWGRQDARGNLTEAQKYAAALPQGRMCIYANCGHLPYLEFPERFNSYVREFVAEVRGGK